MTKRVLVVDDDPDIRELLLDDLEESGVITSQLENGILILETTLHFQPDVIVLDLTMPVVDGYGALGMLKADPRTAGIPVIVASAQISKAAQIAVRELGAADFMTKPWEEGELAWRVEQVAGTATDLAA